MSEEPSPEWMSRLEAEARLQVVYRTLRRLVEEGKIGTLRIPGVNKVLYRRADVEALVRAGTRPASRVELVEA